MKMVGENFFISEESRRRSTLSTKFMNCSLLSRFIPLKSRLGMEVQRYSHLLQSTLVLIASFVGSKDKMYRRISSGKLCKHLMFLPTASHSSFSFCFLGC
ncbi:hypothetical protein ACJW30_05G178500 [Castanea mollissima]